MRVPPVCVYLVSLAVLGLPRLGAEVWHVAPSGSDSAAGTSEGAAFSTIQRGVDMASPGDTVLIHPGVYFENVILKKGGTREQPIRIMADKVEKNRVILTGSVPSVRRGEVPWELVDATLGLYRIPFGYRPTRVLASQVDLFAYPTLESLKAFYFKEDDYPGCRSGFSWNAADQALYVRLRQDGTYGATDPKAATMAVSPPPAGGPYGNIISRADSWNLALQFPGPAHVVIDGLTFETPGTTGVYSEASDLTVRNCWFYGCRYGVSGREPNATKEPVDRVIVEQCYYTQYPAYSDAEDVVRQKKQVKSSNPRLAKVPIHWQRKAGVLSAAGGLGNPFNYETGLTRAMGQDWIVRRNHLYEVFEGFNSGSVSRSVRAEIYENRFERICDNAVETEEHARDIRIHDNLIIDVFEPFSWQPRAGAPLPGPIMIYNNIVWQTSSAIAGGAFKLGASDRNWTGGKMGDIPPSISGAPGGFWVVGNSIYLPAGRALTLLNDASRRYEGFFFLNNIFWVRGITAQSKPLPADKSGLTTNGNLIAKPGGTNAVFSEQAMLFAGKEGFVLPEGDITAAWPPQVNAPFLKTGRPLSAVPLAGLAASPPAGLPSRVGAEVPTFPFGPQPR